MLKSFSDRDKYKVVSFDIFDTIIERSVDVPQEVFMCVGDRVLGRDESEHFVKERISAEHKARSNAENGEVTLKNIYQLLEKYCEKRDELMRTELEIETEICKKKLHGASMLAKAKQENRRVVLISDMYLSSSFLKNVLNNCGVKGFDEIYVSCENGCSKRTGQLFKRVADAEGVRPTEILHLGDSLKADVLGAKKAGVDSVWLIDFKCIKSMIIQKIRQCI